MASPRGLYRHPSEYPGGPSGGPALLQLVSDASQTGSEELSRGGAGGATVDSAGRVGGQRRRVYPQPAHFQRSTTASVLFRVSQTRDPLPLSPRLFIKEPPRFSRCCIIHDKVTWGEVDVIFDQMRPAETVYLTLKCRLLGSVPCTPSVDCKTSEIYTFSTVSFIVIKPLVSFIVLDMIT